jgi:hypothetical protein
MQSIDDCFREPGKCAKRQIVHGGWALRRTKALIDLEAEQFMPAGVISKEAFPEFGWSIPITTAHHHEQGAFVGHCFRGRTERPNVLVEGLFQRPDRARTRFHLDKFAGTAFQPGFEFFRAAARRVLVDRIDDG